MSEAQEREKIYNKLTPQRKTLVDMILQNLDRGAGLWKRGWRMSGAPENAVTGKKYRGVNNLFLTVISMQRGYNDNRWLTFNQMKEREWKFKTDAEGNSLGKKAGVSVEFFELRDRETKKKFDRRVLDGLTVEEREEYLDEIVYPVRKYYTVFNADIIDGIPEQEKINLDESGKSERTERLLTYWNEREAKILYGGTAAYYNREKDEIHLPPRDDFYNLHEFYSTALHELGHSTGSKSRLNRDLTGVFGSETYALEELRAEIASMFMEQDFGISVNEKEVRNNSAYIESWKSAIRDNPNVLFTAIADAEKIGKYVLSKESEMLSESGSVTEEVSKIYMPPSEAAARVIAEESRGQDLPFRGKESLTRMADREIVERLEKAKGAEKFNQLYSGISVTGSEEKDARSLMTRLAMFTNGDGEQLLRVFRSSGQYREKPAGYYEKMAKDAMCFIEKLKSGMTAEKNEDRKPRYANAKI